LWASVCGWEGRLCAPAPKKFQTLTKQFKRHGFEERPNKLKRYSKR
jgi:hypothetical protein